MRSSLRPSLRRGARQSGPLLVREGARRDLDRLIEFNVQLARETEGRELDRSLVSRGVLAVLEHPARGRYFVAEDSEGVAIGQAMVTYEWSDWRNALFWWLQSVFVEPAWRRRGVLRAIFAHIRACAAAQGQGVCGLRLYVTQANEAAIQAYRSLGMDPSDYRLYELDWSSAPQRVPPGEDDRCSD